MSAGPASGRVTNPALPYHLCSRAAFGSNGPESSIEVMKTTSAGQSR